MNQDPGIIPRVVQTLLGDCGERDVSMSASFLELYNEKVFKYVAFETRARIELMAVH